MLDADDTIRPPRSQFGPDKNSLTHLLHKLPRALVEKIVDEIIELQRKDDVTATELKKTLADKIAAVFYLGATQEGILIDQAVESLLQSAENEKRYGLRYFKQTLGSVCNDSIIYLRESVRTDNGHGGRMIQRENSLKSAAGQIIEAWENRFRRRPSYAERRP